MKGQIAAARAWSLSAALAAALTIVLGAAASCGPPVGFVFPGVVRGRPLELWNRSKAYVVFRVTAADVAPLVTPVLPPGGEFNGEVSELLGSLCPASVRIEIFAWSRANPFASALVDNGLEATPFASAVIDMTPTRDYGCRADVDLITLDSPIYCDVLGADAAAAAIDYDSSADLGRQTGLNADAPPPPLPAAKFPLAGRVVNRLGQPLADVEVRFLDFDESLRTDADGRFAAMVPVGAYGLEAVVPGIAVTPGPRRYAHREPTDVPIEFVVLTDAIIQPVP